MPAKNTPPKTFVRCFNTFPHEDTFDFYIDDHLIATHLGYEDFSKYMKVPSGQHQLSLTKHKSKEILTFKRINLRPTSIFTLVASPLYKGEPDQLTLSSLEEPAKPTTPEECLMRTCSFIPDLPPSDFSLIDDYILFKNLKYSTLTAYLPFKIGTYTLKLKSHADETTLYTAPSLVLKPQRFYTTYLIGNGTKAYPYQSILSIDGRSYLKTEKTQEKA